MTEIIQQLETVSSRCRQRAGNPTPLRLIAEAAEREGRPLAAPLSVRIEIIDSCRQRCIFCLQELQKNTRAERGPVPRERLGFLAEEMAELGVAEAVLSGGEPGCHPELAGIVRDFKAEGMKVILETSGADLPLSVLSELGDLLEPARDLVRVSLDAATAETYRVLRGVDAFGEIREVLKALRRANIPFATTTVMMRPNRDELVRIAKDAREAGAVACDFGPPFVGGQSSLPGELELSELLDCCLELLAMDPGIPLHLHTMHAALKMAPPAGGSAFSCTAGLVGCAVDVRGRVAACPYLNDAGFSTGTWKPGTFADLWKRVGNAWAESKAPCPICPC